MPDTASSLYEALLADAGERSLQEVGEKELLNRYLLPLCRAACGDRGLGDDAAVVGIPAGTEAVLSCDRIPTDLLPLELGLMSLEQLGRYIVRVNVSDLAAMAADPIGMLISGAFPASTSVTAVLQLMWGCYDESAAFGCPVLGGDTKSAREQSVSATVLGACPSGRRLTRGPLRPGDSVWLTGSVGTVNAALRWFAEVGGASATHESEAPAVVDRELRRRLIEPVPRVDLVEGLRASDRIVACMDVTDGLGSSLVELADASSVGIVIDELSLPLAPAALWVSERLDVSGVDMTAGIGNDLELVFAVRGEPDLPFAAQRIGTVTDVPGVWLDNASGPHRYPVHGFEHFRRTAREQISGDVCSR